MAGQVYNLVLKLRASMEVVDRCKAQQYKPSSEMKKNKK
jgi:hypothetical protein